MDMETETGKCYEAKGNSVGWSVRLVGHLAFGEMYEMSKGITVERSEA